MLKIIQIGIIKNIMKSLKKQMVLYYANQKKEMKLLKQAESILLHDAPVAPIYQKGEA
ncbi:hypothetical protein HMPREF0294_1315, partial [Corynebacterium glucuronolyticum ATCC 51867]